MKEEEDQVQSGELPENNDDWASPPAHREQETLGQLLARTVAQGTKIYFAAGIQYIERVEPEMFTGSIAAFVIDKEESAKVASLHIYAPGETSFWTDTSRLKTVQTGASVA